MLDKQFNERSPYILGAIALAILIVFGALALTLQRSMFTGGYTLAAEFTSANGLRPGDQVIVAGVAVGKVVAVEIPHGENYVRTELLIEGTELPASTRAQISPKTIVGKRAVQLETGNDFAGEMLGEGDVIGRDRTQVTVDVPEFGNTSQRVLEELDAEALNTFIGSLTEITEGQRDEVALLVEGGGRLTGLVNSQEEQIRDILRNLRGFGETLNTRDQEILSIIDDFRVALAEVNARKDDIRRLLEETRSASDTAADVVAENREQLDAILTELHLDLGLVQRHELELAEALAYAPDSTGGFASIAFAGEEEVPWGHVFTTGLGPVGLDVLLGCGGLLDQQLDQLLGEDPRGCGEQTLPDDTNPDDQGPNAPDLPGDPSLGGAGGGGGLLEAPEGSQDVPLPLESIFEGVAPGVSSSAPAADPAAPTSPATEEVSP